MPPELHSEGVDLLDADEHSWAFAGPSCDGCPRKAQVDGLLVMGPESLGKSCCGPARSGHVPATTWGDRAQTQTSRIVDLAWRALCTLRPAQRTDEASESLAGGDTA